jgi:hypothetical protein
MRSRSKGIGSVDFRVNWQQNPYQSDAVSLCFEGRTGPVLGFCAQDGPGSAEYRLGIGQFLVNPSSAISLSWSGVSLSGNVSCPLEWQGWAFVPVQLISDGIGRFVPTCPMLISDGQ